MALVNVITLAEVEFGGCNSRAIRSKAEGLSASVFGSPHLIGHAFRRKNPLIFTRLPFPLGRLYLQVDPPWWVLM